MTKVDNGAVYVAKEEPSHNAVFSYSYPHGSSAFHPVSPKVLKNTIPNESQSPHEMWKTSSAESAWISSTVNLNSPIKSEPGSSRSNPNEQHSTSHWSKANQEANSPNQTTFRFLIKPNSQSQHGKCTNWLR